MQVDFIVTLFLDFLITISILFIAFQPIYVHSTGALDGGGGVLILHVDFKKA